MASGLKGDTWTWAGSSWKQASDSGPTPRYFAAMAYDAAHNVFVLYGGQTKTGSSDETWTWDGAAWKEMTPAHKPPARRNSAMAYDPVHRVVILYGGHVQGRGEGDVAGDTWTWDGTDWTLARDFTAGTPPDPREGARLITTGDRVLLFGGRFWNTNYYGDLWAWDGKAWTLVDKDPRPAGRGNPAVVWNRSDSTMFVFGGTGIKASAGVGAQGDPLGDAWTWASGGWARQQQESGPPPLAFSVGIWDASAKRAIVMLGMPCPNASDEAWAWSNGAWSKLAKPGISARWGAASAQAPDGRAALFGGSDEAGC